MMMMMMT